MKAIAAFCAAWLLLMAGCTTSPQNAPGSFATAGLVGVVYSYNGRPVFGARVSLESGQEVRTDINGRFFLPNVPRGTVELVVTHPEFLQARQRLQFLSRTQVAYVRLERPAFAVELHRAEQALLDGFFAAASKTLEELSPRVDSQSQEARALYDYLSALCRFREGMPQAAARHLSAVPVDLRGPAWNRLHNLVENGRTAP